MGEYVTLDKRFTVFLTGSSGSVSYFHIFFLIPFLEEAFLRNIIPYVNCIIVIWIKDSGSVINNNCGRLQDLILLFKIPMDTLTYFCEIYRKFGYAPSKSFGCPILDRVLGSTQSPIGRVP